MDLWVDITGIIAELLFSQDMVKGEIDITLPSLSLYLLSFLKPKFNVLWKLMTKAGTKKVYLHLLSLSTFVSENFFNVPENHNFLQGNSRFNCCSRKYCLPKSLSSVSLKRNLLFSIKDCSVILKHECQNEALSVNKQNLYSHVLICISFVLLDEYIVISWVTLYSFANK